jgi:ribose transport system permease protein
MATAGTAATRRVPTWVWSLQGNLRYAIPYLLFVVCWVVVALSVPGFGTLSHFLYMVQFSGFLGIVAAGQTVVIISGGIDLSVGAMVTLAGVTITQVMYATPLGFAPAVALALLGAALFGFLNGLGIGLLRIPPLVMTLASSTIIRGIALLITNGTPHEVRIPWFQEWVVKPGHLGVNGVLQTWIIVSLAILVLLERTVYGKRIFLTGSNPTAALYAGYSPRRLTFFVYILSSVLSACAGIVSIAFTGNSYLGMGDTYQLGSIAAVVLGGTSILGGTGSYLGTIAGSLLLTLITSVLTLFRVSGGGQNAVEGAIILVLMAAYALGTRTRDQ